MLLGRPVPADAESWRDASLDKVVSHVEPPRSTRARSRSSAPAWTRRSRKTGVPLSREDLATIDRFHRRFIEAGVGLRFQSTGRPPQSHYPTYRDLLLATDALGERSNYLASEESFQFIKSLQQRDLVIPVVGDLSGPRALAAIGSLLRQRGQRLSAFYASNVEFYLFGDGRFDRFVDNLGGMPRAEQRRRHPIRLRPLREDGGGSSSHLQSVNELVTGFAKGRFRDYGDLIDGR